MGTLELALKATLTWCANNFRCDVVINKSIFFILGLIFSYKLVDKLFFNILIMYLTPPSEDYDLQKAAILVNFKGGIYSVLTIMLAFVADAYVGLFKMVVSSSILCITGLVLIHFAAKRYDDNHRFDDFLDMFYPALLLMTLSEAAIMVTMESFFGDQLVARDQAAATAEEDKRTVKRTRFWLYSVSFFAAILVFCGPIQNYSLAEIARVLAILMGAGLFWFLLGFKLYNRVKPTGSALSNVPVVICNAIIKRNVAYPQSSEQLHQNCSNGHVQILPHVSWLRWLDKAAVVQENRAGRICSVEQVKGVKYLVKLLPMWLTFITFSLVYAFGDTFFLEEASSITNDPFPIQFFTHFQRFTELMVSEASDYVVEKLCEKKKYNAQRMMLVRIGIGMSCCMLCCIAAWTQAVHRLEAKNDMSVYRLTPQFLLLAFMGGLSSDGLENFFDSQVSRSMFRYGPSFGECVMGIGKFVSIVCILILSKWFGSGAESSRLDKYYLVLAVLSYVNIMAYFFVARWYGDDTFVVANDANSGLQIVIDGEEQRESSRLLSGVRSFPPPSGTRGLYNRFRSMP